MNLVVGLGAGGHAKVVLDILRQLPGYRVIGLLAPDPATQGIKVLEVPVLGSDILLPGLCGEGVSHFFVGVGSIGDNSLRTELYRRATSLGLIPVTAVHPKATVAPSAFLGAGITIMAGVIWRPLQPPPSTRRA